MKREDLEKHLKEIVSESETLFGNVAELTSEELLEVLAETGASPAEIRDALYRQLDKVVIEFRMSGKPVPPRYLEAREQLRPLSEVPQNVEAAQRHARGWISELLKAPPTNAVGELAPEFHKKAALTEEDQRILDEAIERLRSRMQGNRNE